MKPNLDTLSQAQPIDIQQTPRISLTAPTTKKLRQLIILLGFPLTVQGCGTFTAAGMVADAAVSTVVVAGKGVVKVVDAVTPDWPSSKEKK